MDYNSKLSDIINKIYSVDEEILKSDNLYDRVELMDYKKLLKNELAKISCLFLISIDGPSPELIEKLASLEQQQLNLSKVDDKDNLKTDRDYNLSSVGIISNITGERIILYNLPIEEKIKLIYEHTEQTISMNDPIIQDSFDTGNQIFGQLLIDPRLFDPKKMKKEYGHKWQETLSNIFKDAWIESMKETISKSVEIGKAKREETLSEGVKSRAESLDATNSMKQLNQKIDTLEKENSILSQSMDKLAKTNKDVEQELKDLQQENANLKQNMNNPLPESELLNSELYAKNLGDEGVDIDKLSKYVEDSIAVSFALEERQSSHQTGTPEYNQLLNYASRQTANAFDLSNTPKRQILSSHIPEEFYISPFKTAVLEKEVLITGSRTSVFEKKVLITGIKTEEELQAEKEIVLQQNEGDQIKNYAISELYDSYISDARALGLSINPEKTI